MHFVDPWWRYAPVKYSDVHNVHVVDICESLCRDPEVHVWDRHMAAGRLARNFGLLRERGIWAISPNGCRDGFRLPWSVYSALLKED